MAEDLEEDFEDSEPSSEPASEGGSKGGMKKIILIVAPIVLLLGVGAGLYFSGLLDGLLGKKPAEAEGSEEAAPKEEAHKEEPKKEEHGEKKEEHGAKKEKKKEGGHEGAGGAAPSSVFMDLPDLLVNLQSTGRKQSFLKLHVALELDNPMDQPKVDAVMPRIIDSFQVYLRELRTDDLQGAAGMHLLREELLSRVSLAVQPVKVKDILFREILIQ